MKKPKSKKETILQLDFKIASLQFVRHLLCKYLE